MTGKVFKPAVEIRSYARTMVVYFRNLRIETSGDVYEPAEDSFLLADNVRLVEGGSFLDVGTGTGIVALSAAGKAGRVVGVDVDVKAVELAKHNAILNKITNAEFLPSDLFENVRGKFDLIAFNPPYLPVSDKGLLSNSWSGGRGGVETLNTFIEQSKNHLKAGGGLEFISSSLMDLKSVEKKLDDCGFSHSIVASKKLFFERLDVVFARVLF